MARNFEKELQDLDAAMAASPSALASEHFGVSLMQESLGRRRELLVAEASGALDLVLSGDDPSTTGDEISLVARVLDALQESLASIAQVLAGEHTSRGLIPGSIKDLVALRIAAMAPGSLQLKLVPLHPEVADMTEPQASLLEDARASSDEEDGEDLPLLDQSIDHLLGLLSTQPDESGDLLHNLAYVGPRATSHLHDLTKALNEGGANLSFAWRSCHGQREAEFTRAASQVLANTLEEVTEASREVVVTGRIVGGSLVHRTFELEPVGEEQGLIAGKVSEEALANLERLFGETCTAHMEVREARLSSGETREAHFLTALAE